MPPVLGRAALVSAVALLLAGAAQAGTVAVIVVPPFPLDRYAGRGAVGLMPAGAGPTVTRRGALAALVRGKVESSLLGGTPGGKPSITLSRHPARTTIYVALPPPGRPANDRRYPIAVVGPGFGGILESRSTRIPGLVSIADVAPTVRALARGETGPISSTAGTPSDLRALDVRLAAQLRARDAAVAILAFLALTLTLVAFASSSIVVARAALLAAPLAVSVAVALSALGVTRLAVLLAALAVLTLALSLAGGALLDARGVAVAFVVLIAAYLAVLATRPTWAALAAVGPNPGGGTRFYGSGNLTTSVLLASALFAAGTLGRRSLAPIALLSLVTVGWSRAGADGGGIIVLVAAFTVLGRRLATGRITARTIAFAAALAAATGLALVGVDAATGGHSHVTHRVGEGPRALVDELANRLHISVESIATSWHAALVFAVAIAALAVLATRPPRFAVGEALLVGIAVSLVVNDSPQQVAAAGAISYGALWVHERVRLSALRPRG